MDARENLIRELEEEKRAGMAARNRLLEGLGQALLQRTGEGRALPEDYGAILDDYRRLQKELDESNENSRNLETETRRLKELEHGISGKEAVRKKLEGELADLHIRLGKALLSAPESDGFAGPLKQKEETLLARIEEQENKLEETGSGEGGVLGWLGKNARMAVSRTLIVKDRAALGRLYRGAGMEFLSPGQEAALDPGMAGTLAEAQRLKGLLSSLDEELAGLRAGRRELAELRGAGAPPSARAHGYERHAARIKEELRGVYLRSGRFAAGSGGKEALSALLTEEDTPVLDQAAALQSRISGNERGVEKLKAAISIDSGKARIDKMMKTIGNHRGKIAAAEEAIAALEKQIAGVEGHIEELNAFLADNE